jgi:sec-independent protein translocase protein TatA
MFTGLFQPSHIIVLGIVALVFLGPKRIPEAARSLGHAFREFRSSIGEHHDAEPAEALPASTPARTDHDAHAASAPQPDVGSKDERREPVGLA